MGIKKEMQVLHPHAAAKSYYFNTKGYEEKKEASIAEMFEIKLFDASQEIDGKRQILRFFQEKKCTWHHPVYTNISSELGNSFTATTRELYALAERNFVGIEIGTHIYYCLLHQ